MTSISKDKKTESDLEARIHAVLLKVFPWLNEASITHQNQFSMKFGHAKVTVDGKDIKSKSGRLDILINYEGKPLVVLELKREGLSLTEDDYKQGLSYARMIEAMPPLVVVTNGVNTKVFRSYDGIELSDDVLEESYFLEVISTVGVVATKDLKDAINTLMGTNDGFWKNALIRTTEGVIADLEGDLSDMLQPFAKKLLIHRKATSEIEALLKKGKKMVILEGPPLSGKSSVLREISINSITKNDSAVLFIEADSTNHGLFQNIASSFTKELGWNVNEDDIRNWLSNISKSKTESRVVIAIDGVRLGQDKIRKDIDELVSKVYGSTIQLLITLDDSVTNKWILSSNQRKKTAIGRVSETVSLSSLDEDEFKHALKELSTHHVAFMRGSEFTKEYRLPWMLRYLVADIAESVEYIDESKYAVIPSIIGLELFDFAEKQLQSDIKLLSSFSLLAKCIITDVTNTGRSISLRLESMSTFVVQRKTIYKYFDYSEITTLEEDGYLKWTGLDSNSNEIVVVPRLPELVAYSIAIKLSSKFSEKYKKNPESAVQWIIGICSNLPMGEVIGAKAILESAINFDGISLDVINHMLKVKPKKTDIKAGTKAVMHYPGSGLINLEFTVDGNIMASARGKEPALIEIDECEKAQFQTMDGIESWLILSHMCSNKLMMRNDSNNTSIDIVPSLLLEIASCPFVLRRPSSNFLDEIIQTIEVPNYGEIVCNVNGVIEPVTSSLMKIIDNMDTDDADFMVNEAVNRNSLALLYRFDIALGQLSHVSDKVKAEWAVNIRETKINSAIKKNASLH